MKNQSFGSTVTEAPKPERKPTMQPGDAEKADMMRKMEIAGAPGPVHKALEAFVGVCDKLGISTGIDFFKIVDAAEDVVRPAMPEECLLDRLALTMGYSGVYSSFLKHAFHQAERYGVSGTEILLRAGRRKLVGGQEDQLTDIALELQREQAPV